MKKMLLVFAHPDDESFTTAGTVAKYVKAGWKVDLVCATRGEKGMRRGVEDQVTPLGELRTRELTQAAEVLGIRSIVFLDYEDGTLSQKTPGEIEDKLQNVLWDTRPDVVITFEPAGITNHPDHVKLSLATTYAYQQYAKMRQVEHPGDETPPKLYFVCMAATTANYLISKKIIPSESFGKVWKGVDDKFVSTVIDIKRFKTTKIKAMKSHATQSEDVERFLSLPTNPILYQETYVLRMVGINEAYMGKNDRISDRL